MCTWITESADVVGSAKGVPNWIAVNKVNVYFDHPVHAPLEHALILDFVNEAYGTSARIGVELSAEAAKELVAAINRALQIGEAQHELALAGYATA